MKNQENKLEENILLTGGAGMLGKNILMHNKNEQYRFLFPTSKELNLFDEIAVNNYIQSKKIDIIIHCAATVGGIQANISAPVKYLSDNIIMGFNLVNAAKNNAIKKLINLGSSCMYPKDYTSPLKEEYILKAPLEPTNEGYALAKITVAKLCEYISRQYGYAYKTVIPCNLYGLWDKFSDNVSHMIPAVIKKIHVAKENNLPSVEIWGDGLSRREFMYAEDCADAIYFILEHISNIPDYVNIGLGYDYSINEYYQKIAKVIGYTGEFNHNLTKPSGMKHKLVDTTVLSNLGWQATHDIESGLNKTYEFFKNCES